MEEEGACKLLGTSSCGIKWGNARGAAAVQRRQEALISPPGVYLFYSHPPFNNEHNYLLPGAGRNQVHSKKVNSSGVNFILTSIDIIIDSGPEFAMLFGSAFGDHDQSVKQQVSLESAAKSSI